MNLFTFVVFYRKYPFKDLASIIRKAATDTVKEEQMTESLRPDQVEKIFFKFTLPVLKQQPLNLDFYRNAAIFELNLSSINDAKDVLGEIKFSMGAGVINNYYKPIDSKNFVVATGTFVKTNLRAIDKVMKEETDTSVNEQAVWLHLRSHVKAL